METEKTQHKPNSKWSWIIGIILVIAGLDMLSDSLALGITYLLAGTIIMPPVSKMISEKTGIFMSNKIKIISVVVLFAIGGLVGLSAKMDSDQATTQQVNQQENTEAAVEAQEKVDYELLTDGPYVPNGHRYSVLLPENSSQSDVRSVAQKIVSEDNSGSDEITIFFWDDKRQYELGTSYNVAEAEWSGGEISYQWVENNKDSSLKPTSHELEIYDYYWEVFDEPGNPRGYVSHPTTDEQANAWELQRIERITAEYDISTDRLFEIVRKTLTWQFSQ
ncbi:MAG: hypothetical protein WD335_03575 [Candidatus Paceibacterota bacterium]